MTHTCRKNWYIFDSENQVHSLAHCIQAVYQYIILWEGSTLSFMSSEHYRFRVQTYSSPSRIFQLKTEIAMRVKENHTLDAVNSNWCISGLKQCANWALLVLQKLSVRLYETCVLVLVKFDSFCYNLIHRFVNNKIDKHFQF